MLARLRHGTARFAVVVAVGALPILPAPAARADGPSPLDIDFADPFVLREGDRYYAFATGARGQNIQVARSRNLADWTMLPDALPNLPDWAASVRGLTWAPSALRRGARFVLYYTTA